jgi:hypothetical protein
MERLVIGKSVEVMVKKKEKAREPAGKRAKKEPSASPSKVRVAGKSKIFSAKEAAGVLDGLVQDSRLVATNSRYDTKVASVLSFCKLPEMKQLAENGVTPQVMAMYISYATHHGLLPGQSKAPRKLAGDTVKKTISAMFARYWNAHPHLAPSLTEKKALYKACDGAAYKGGKAVKKDGAPGVITEDLVEDLIDLALQQNNRGRAMEALFFGAFGSRSAEASDAVWGDVRIINKELVLVASHVKATVKGAKPSGDGHLVKYGLRVANPNLAKRIIELAASFPKDELICKSFSKKTHGRWLAEASASLRWNQKQRWSMHSYRHGRSLVGKIIPSEYAEAGRAVGNTASTQKRHYRGKHQRSERE